jgi:peptide/nickel transport system substrate-binding protein
MAGAMDMQFRHMSLNNYPLLSENAEQGDYRIFQWTLGQGSATAFMPNMNHEDPGIRELMADKRFRHALSVALDRDEINEVVYLGMGVPRQASVVPAYPYFKPSQAEAYAQYDPQQANAWLDEIGLTARDEEGFRLRLDGQRLTISVEYVPILAFSDVVEMAVHYWAEVGLRVFPKEVSRSLFGERSLAGGVQEITVWVMDRAAHALLSPLFQMPIRGFSPGSNGALWHDWYTSGGEKGEQPPAEVQKAYELIEACKSAPNAEALALYATELLDLNAEELWVIGTVGLLPHVGVVKTNVHNVPEQALSDWLCLTPGNTTVEQYFFQD